MIKLYDILKEGTRRISDEYIRKIAKQYDNKPLSDFIKDYPNLYAVIKNREEEYFSDVTKNMIRQKKKWTDEELEREAKKYNHKNDFRKNSRKAYDAALNRGRTRDPKTGKIKYDPSFFKKITAHMTPLGDFTKRLIYVHEFTDKNNKPVAAYVGLTFNSQLRYKQHTTGVDKLGRLKDTPVTQFIRDNPTLKHTYKELTGFLETYEAVKQEQFWEDKYKDDGWLILGKRRAGSIGSGYMVKDSDLKDFVDAQAKNGLNLTDLRKKYPNQLNLIYQRELHLPPHNYLKKFERSKTAYTDESVFEKAMNYDSITDIRNKDKNFYSVLQRRELIPKVRQAFEERNKTSIKVDEAKVVPANILLPMLTSDSTEESHSIDYDNIAKNIKRFKSLIAAKLKSYSLDKDTLDRFLINYANGYIEVDHAGEAYEALHNITLQEWLDDIVGAFEYMYEEDEEMKYEPDPRYDELTIDDIR